MWKSIKNKFRKNKHVDEGNDTKADDIVTEAETDSTVTADVEKNTDDTVEISKEEVLEESAEAKIEAAIFSEHSETNKENDTADTETVEETATEGNDSVNDSVAAESEKQLEVTESKTDNLEEKTEESAPEKTKKKGFFGKLIDGLTKTRDSFVSGLENVFSGFSEIDDDFYEELEEVLIMADIGVVTTEKIIENLQEKVKENKIKEIEVCRQLLIDSIKEQMRVHEDAYEFENKKSVVMLIGVNGVGKTTSVGKLASQFKAQGKKVILAAADTFRAAAIEQLTEWSNRAGVELIAGQEGGDPAAVVYDAVNASKARNADVLICDTAGRLHNKKNLMEELKKINRIVEREYPDAYRETLVVLDGTTGQNALAQAKQFNEVADITGIILTKLDGTAKGGIAIAIQSEMNIPVKYIGIGEHIEDLQKFDADAFVDALFEKKTVEN